MNSLEKIVSNSGLDKSKSDYLLEKFADATALAESWAQKAKEIVVTDESQTDLMKSAREGRLLLKDRRVEIEKTRKQLKEASLKEGRAIDDIAKALTSLIAPTEEYLQLQEDFAKIKEQKRISDLNMLRQELIRAYLNPYEEVGNLGVMPDNQFNALLGGYKIAYQSKVDAEKKAEEDRIAQQKADEEAREAQLIENERLKKEEDEREKQFAAERKAAQEKADKERAELQRIQKEQDEVLRKEREAREKADAELKAQKDREAQAQLKLIEEREALESAPDRQKIENLVFRLQEFDFPQVKTKKAKAIIQAAQNKMQELIDNITQSSSKL